MIDAHQLMLFIPAMAVITLLPGQDMLFVLAQSAQGGARRGMIAVLGVISAFFAVHLAGAALGISALIVNSLFLFNALKYAGAAYLLYLGVRAFLAREAPSSDAEGSSRSHGSPFLQGFITNVLNPKVAIFMLAFLPQFVVPANGHVALQILWLGSMWGLFGVIVLGGVALAGGTFTALRSRSARVRNIERYITGTIFIGLGLRVALPEQR